MPNHVRHHYDGFDEAFHSSFSYPLSDPLPATELVYQKAFQIARYIHILQDYSKKDDPDNSYSIEKNSNWYEILWVRSSSILPCYL